MNGAGSPTATKQSRNLFSLLKKETNESIITYITYREITQNFGRDVGRELAKTLECFKTDGSNDARANYDGWYSSNLVKRLFFGHLKKEVETVCEEVALKAISLTDDLKEQTTLKTEFNCLLNYIHIGKYGAHSKEEFEQLGFRNTLLPSYTQGVREGIVEEGLKSYKEAYDNEIARLRAESPKTPLDSLKKAFNDGRSWVGEEKGKDSGKADARDFMSEKPYEHPLLIVTAGGESSADSKGYSFYPHSRPNLDDGRTELVKEAAAHLKEGKNGPFYRFSFLRGAKTKFGENYRAGYNKG